jgi:hypothetical protein
MNAEPTYDGLDLFEDPVDRLLAQIALELQLPRSLHDQVDDRYSAVRRKLENTAAFNGLIEHFYPQGSMAVDATISIRGTDDEYDLDIVAQLGGRFREMAPLPILLEIERALADYPVQAVTRRTRCVTLHYADKMHLDVTPGLRTTGTIERESYIAHAKGPRSTGDDRFVEMNAYGFAGWYRVRTPIEYRLAKSFDRHLRHSDGTIVMDEAEVDEVPDHTHFIVKNTATLALQLLKRFRNVRYADYAGRIPPSVMLSYYAALSAHPNMRLSDMVIRIANWIVRDIEQATLNRRRLHVANPVCPDDIFTDRWPDSFAQQNEFANHLRDLVQGLEAIRRMEFSPDVIREWLRERFGSHVVTKAADRMAREIGSAIQGAAQSYSRKGVLLVPTAGRALSAATAPLVAPASAARAHSFYGVKI